jgi:hypothetical protein
MPDLQANKSFRPIEVDSDAKMTVEFACAYSEYTVVKTNSRGRKQKRVLGIDESTIYNKPPRGTVASAITAALPVFNTPSFMRRASVESGVQRASRPMASVASVDLIGNKEMCFNITFHDHITKKTTTREYMTETITECLEIVTKINILISLNRRRLIRASGRSHSS